MEEEYSKKKNKLYKALENNIKISDKNLGDKFTHFEDSKLNESVTLLYEIENRPKYYKRFARGRIIRVKFGVNIGSEFSGDHFAIVISKKDTMMNPTLHVIPISSKKHKKSYEIGNILYNEDELEKLKNMYNEEKDVKTKKEIEKVIKYYSNRKGMPSYACIDHIKTISKLSISKFINDYDYLSNLKCSSELLKELDNEIINEYIV